MSFLGLEGFRVCFLGLCTFSSSETSWSLFESRIDLEALFPEVCDPEIFPNLRSEI